MVEELYRVYGEEIRRYCFWLSRETAQSEDLSQEVFIRAMSSLEDLIGRSEEEKRAWLYKTARNLFLDEARRKTSLLKRMRLLYEGEEEEGDFGGVEAEQLLLPLPPELRALVRLRYLEGYNATELGEMYSLPPATIRSKLLRARMILKKQLANGGK